MNTQMHIEKGSSWKSPLGALVTVQSVFLANQPLVGGVVRKIYTVGYFVLGVTLSMPKVEFLKLFTPLQPAGGPPLVEAAKKTAKPRRTGQNGWRG